MIYVIGWLFFGLLAIVLGAIEERITNSKSTSDDESTLFFALILGPITLLLLLFYLFTQFKLLTRFYNYIRDVKLK